MNSEGGEVPKVDKVEWVPLNGEVRGVRISEAVSQLIAQGAADTTSASTGADSRPCGGLLDLYVACAREYNIELCDDEKFLYRKCIREFVDRGCARKPRAGTPALRCAHVPHPSATCDGLVARARLAGERSEARAEPARLAEAARGARLRDTLALSQRDCSFKLIDIWLLFQFHRILMFVSYERHSR